MSTTKHAQTCQCVECDPRPVSVKAAELLEEWRDEIEKDCGGPAMLDNFLENLRTKFGGES